MSSAIPARLLDGTTRIQYRPFHLDNIVDVESFLRANRLRDIGTIPWNRFFPRTIEEFLTLPGMGNFRLDLDFLHGVLFNGRFEHVRVNAYRTLMRNGCIGTRNLDMLESLNDFQRVRCIEILYTDLFPITCVSEAMDFLATWPIHELDDSTPLRHFLNFLRIALQFSLLSHLYFTGEVRRATRPCRAVFLELYPELGLSKRDPVRIEAVACARRMNFASSNRIALREQGL